MDRTSTSLSACRVDGETLYPANFESVGADRRSDQRGLFIDEGSADQYQAKSGFGDSSEKSAAGFFDLEGHDSYTLSDSSISAETRPSDGKLFFYPHGGVFVDR